jgi:endonuclease/exonuclease/phosphatase family metal-dependent hydrolase
MRIASFNVENLDDVEPAPTSTSAPTFAERLAILRPQLERLRADVLCLQEVHGQDLDGEPRQLRALKTLVQGTRYETYQLRSTTLAGQPDVERFRNLVTMIPPVWTFEEAREVLHEFSPPPEYNAVTETPDAGSRAIRWDRPLLYCRVRTPTGLTLHVLNAHYKSKNPTPITGQGPENFMFRTAAGWAEGFFLSSIKRVGAALETRIFLDLIFADDPDARIVLAGDLNSESHEVPVMTVRGDVNSHGNPALNHQIMYPCEDTVPEDSRFTLYHKGRKNMLDHLLVSRKLMGAYRHTEIHNEFLNDESVAFAVDKKFPASDHAPVIAEFDEELLSRIGNS